jgi:hypothetical protein
MKFSFAVMWETQSQTIWVWFQSHPFAVIVALVHYWGFTMVLPWFYHGFTMVLPWFYHIKNEQFSASNMLVYPRVTTVATLP